MREKVFSKLKSVFLVLIIFIMVFSTVSCGKRNDDNTEEVGKFQSGIVVEGIDIGGLTIAEATEKLSLQLDGENEVILKINENEWIIKFEEIGGVIDYEKALNKAMKISDNSENNSDIKITYLCDRELLKSKLSEINEKTSAADDKFVMDIDKTADKVIDCLSKGNLEPITPIENEEEMAEEKTLIGSFSTAFSADDKNRNENLRVACEKINGIVLQPGDIFDMNEALGPQTAENGYKSAGAIENGKIVSAIGGGVCQVTTTMYNAAIFAELKIVERHNHSLMVGYVPLGRDAAVAGTYRNLRFQNDTDYPVYIEAYIENNNVVCNIYGHEIHDEGHRVEFERVWVATIGKPSEKVTNDPNMYEGEREVTYNGKTGAKIDTYKLVYEGDELVSREWFSSSTYIATADEVRVGTKPREVEDVPVIGEPSDTMVPADPNIPSEPSVPVEQEDTQHTPSKPDSSIPEDVNAEEDKPLIPKDLADLVEQQEKEENESIESDEAEESEISVSDMVIGE